MSYKVTEEFIENSRSTLGARTVGLIIAEIAHPDGVGWLRQEPTKRKRQRAGSVDKKNIAFRTKLSGRQIRRCIDRLQEIDELEIVLAWDGRERFHIYRLIVGGIRGDEDGVDYGRGLPRLEVERSFWTPEQLRLPVEQRPMLGHVPPPSISAFEGNPRVDNLSARQESDGMPDERTSARGRADIHDRDERTSVQPRTVNGARVPVPRTGPDHVQQQTKTVQRNFVASSASDAGSGSAAASESEPLSIEQAVELLSTLNGWDSKSIVSVQPLLFQVPASVVVTSYDKTLARKSRNPVGMFVHILRAAIPDWREAQHQARLETWEQFFGEQGIEHAKRTEPERYVLAWATPALESAQPLPAYLVNEHVIDFLFEYVEPHTERLRILGKYMLAMESRPQARRSADRLREARAQLRDWILKAIDIEHRPLDEVLSMIDGFSLGTIAEDDPTRLELIAFAHEIHANVQRELGERAA